MNQVCRLQVHAESRLRPVWAAALVRGASITDDCDIPNAPFLLARQRRSQGAILIEPGMLVSKASILYRALVFLMRVGDASPIATPERPEGLRGCGAERKLHASGRRAVCHPGSR